MNCGSYHKTSLTSVTTAYKARKLHLVVNHKNLSKSTIPFSIFEKYTTSLSVHGRVVTIPGCLFLSHFFYLILPWSFQALLYFSIFLCFINNGHRHVTAEIDFTLSQCTVSKRHWTVIMLPPNKLAFLIQCLIAQDGILILSLLSFFSSWSG